MKGGAVRRVRHTGKQPPKTTKGVTAVADAIVRLEAMHPPGGQVWAILDLDGDEKIGSVVTPSADAVFL
eukprot:10190910-Karenia_brevis.AAC.1